MSQQSTRELSDPGSIMDRVTTLDNVFDLLDLEQAIDAGFVRTQEHADLPYVIYNYTERAAYEDVWTPVTLACRGLIADESGTVLARPFRKFMNYGQAGAAQIPLDAPVSVTDKMDGSLGVMYPLQTGGWAIATRGSFASEQAIHATHVLRTRYADFKPPLGMTVLFEIVFPTNRIVVDYGDMDDLVLLGGVDIETGESYGPGWIINWTGPRTEVFPFATLAEALAAEPRPNAEGLVVHCLTTDARIKLKQADYVALHRIVTGLNARTVWQHMVDGKPLAELIAPLPDEFRPWVESVAATIAEGVETSVVAIEHAYAEVVSQLQPGYTRKEFAALAVPHPLKWALFLAEDGRDPRPELLRRAEPEAFWTPAGRRFGEDTA